MDTHLRIICPWRSIIYSTVRYWYDIQLDQAVSSLRLRIDAPLKLK